MGHVLPQRPKPARYARVITPTYSGRFIRPSSLNEYTPASRSSGDLSINIKSFVEKPITARSVILANMEADRAARNVSRFPLRPPIMLENRHCPETATHNAPCANASTSTPVSAVFRSYLKRTLSGRSETRKTHFLRESCALCIVDGHIHPAGVQHKLRKTHLRRFSPRPCPEPVRRPHSHRPAAPTHHRRSSVSHCLTSVLTVT